MRCLTRHLPLILQLEHKMEDQFLRSPKTIEICFGLKVTIMLLGDIMTLKEVMINHFWMKQ